MDSRGPPQAEQVLQASDLSAQSVRVSEDAIDWQESTRTIGKEAFVFQAMDARGSPEAEYVLQASDTTAKVTRLAIKIVQAYARI